MHLAEQLILIMEWQFV